MKKLFAPAIVLSSALMIAAFFTMYMPTKITHADGGSSCRSACGDIYWWCNHDTGGAPSCETGYDDCIEYCDLQ
jgi:hypothetical protein